MRRPLDKALRSLEGTGTPALVVPLWWTGLAVVRSLRARDVPVLALELGPREPCSYSRLCPTVVVDGGQEELWHTVLEVGERLADRRPALFLASDHDVLETSERREELAPFFRFRLPEREWVRVLMDKLAFAAFAERHGLPVPRSYLVHAPDDWATVVREATFPVVVKPKYRTASWRQSGLPKVIRVDDERTLKGLLELLVAAESEFAVQEWIDGPDSQLYFHLAWCGSEGRPSVAWTCRKLRQWPPRTGSSSAVEGAAHDEVRELTERIFALVKFQGFGSMEYKIDASGRPIAIEPCVGRVNLQEDAARVNGVDIVYRAYCDLVEITPPQERPVASRRWFHLCHDFRSFRDGRRLGDELSFREFLGSYRGARYYADFSWTDPLPFLVELKAEIARAVRRARRIARRGPKWPAEPNEVEGRPSELQPRG